MKLFTSKHKPQEEPISLEDLEAAAQALSELHDGTFYLKQADAQAWLCEYFQVTA